MGDVGTGHGPFGGCQEVRWKRLASVGTSYGPFGIRTVCEVMR